MLFLLGGEGGVIENYFGRCVGGVWFVCGEECFAVGLTVVEVCVLFLFGEDFACLWV